MGDFADCLQNDLRLNDWPDKAAHWMGKLGLEDENLQETVDRVVKEVAAGSGAQEYL